MSNHSHDITTDARRIDSLAPKLLAGGVAAAVVGLGGAAALAGLGDHPLERFLQTYIVSYAFWLSIAVGGLFFVMLQHVTRAGWSVVVRRVAEGIGANVVLMAVLAVPVVAGMHHLYHWSHADVIANDPLVASKVGYLNPGFFTVRMVAYFVIWCALALFFYRTSVRQDATGDPGLTRRMEKLSAPGLVLFALSLNFAAFDLLMSLDSHWFSTIFGVYYFGGSVVGVVAFLAIAMLVLQATGHLRRTVTTEHYHDLGKLLFAFTVFWAYIAFSQYMLIWYANLPEETGWFLKRQTGDWTWISLGLLFGHFVLPFLLLVSRFVKRRPVLLAAAATWMLAMHWMDMYWLAVPEFSPAVARFGITDVLCFVGIGGLFLACLALWLRRVPVVPERDPRLAESVAFENA